ncbi:MAG: hypothetical protein PVJ42_09870 [bacterium]
MKRIVFTTLIMAAAIAAAVTTRPTTAVTAGDPLSPLYGARLAETLAEWEAGALAQHQDSDDPAWWPASFNPASLCIGSLCPQSLCIGSACIESTCIGSGCIGSMCIGSGCAASMCGVSGCAGTTLCLKKCGYISPPSPIDPNGNGTTFHNGTCNEP